MTESISIDNLMRSVGAEFVSDTHKRKVSKIKRGAPKKKPGEMDALHNINKGFRVLEAMRLICRNPMSLDQIAARLGTSQRTIYRYLVFMVDIGADVKVNSEGEYHIDRCPVCNDKLA